MMKEELKRLDALIAQLEREGYEEVARLRQIRPHLKLRDHNLGLDYFYAAQLASSLARVHFEAPLGEARRKLLHETLIPLLASFLPYIKSEEDRLKVVNCLNRVSEKSFVQIAEEYGKPSTRLAVIKLNGVPIGIVPA